MLTLHILILATPLLLPRKVDKFLKNLIQDENFKNWADKKRNNKRIKRLLDIMDK